MEVGVIWGEGREQETAGGLGDRSREGGERGNFLFFFIFLSFASFLL